MKTIQSVALLGAGAIGAYFIYGLSRVEGLDFYLVAEGERRERLQRDGVVINQVTFHPPVKTPEEARGADLLLIATKYDGLKGAISQIQEIVTEETTVLSLLNGVDSEELLARHIDPERIAYSLMRITAERKGNSVVFDAAKTPGLYIGEKGSSVETERLLAIRELMERAGLGYHFCADILAEQWSKYALNIAYNLPQALIGVGCGAYTDSVHVKHIRTVLEAEVRAVASAYGITFDLLPDNSARWMRAARFSTLQDLDNHRHTEIDMFTGVLMEKAAAVGIGVPYATFIHHAIKAMEEKNDGLFDYVQGVTVDAGSGNDR